MVIFQATKQLIELVGSKYDSHDRNKFNKLKKKLESDKWYIYNGGLLLVGPFDNEGEAELALMSVKK